MTSNSFSMAALLLFPCIALGYSPSTTDMNALEPVKYRGIRPTDPGGRNGLRNPERGFRTETIIAEQTGRTKGVWGIPAHLSSKVGPGYSDQNWLADIRRFSADGVTLIQAYCYLTEHNAGPISQAKLDLLNRSFEAMRSSGAKCVLRFAYIKDYPATPPPPTTEQMLLHMDQLAPILKRNSDVIHTLEAGFIAAWGEWHHGSHITADAERAALLKRILEITPPNIFVQVRYPGIKTSLLPLIMPGRAQEVTKETAFSSAPSARIGYHDDGVLTFPKGMEGYIFGREPEIFGDLRGMVQRESSFVPVGGELFWSDQGWYGEGVYHRNFDGLEAARFLGENHINVMSLAHSYSEREGKPMSIDHWRRRTVTPEELVLNRLPVSRDWFTDFEGKAVERTAFEYIRDHLGYRIELQEASLPRKLRSGRSLQLSIKLINRGFSTLFHPRPVYIVLVDGNGLVTVLPSVKVDARRWFPHDPSDELRKALVHAIDYSDQVPKTLKPGHYSLGVWMPDASPRLRKRADYALRFANGDVPFWTSADGRFWGINLLGAVEVLAEQPAPGRP